MNILVLQRLLLEFALDFLYFPLWWYTDGTRRAFLFVVDMIKNGNDQLAPGLWLKNIFVPMFGQIDWQGRLMSIFIRLINVLGRTLALTIWCIVAALLFIFWLALPVSVGYMFVQSFV